MKIPIIRKLKGAKHSGTAYMTYVLSFPDGDQWVKQTPFQNFEIDRILRNMIAEHSRAKKGQAWEWKNRAMALWKTGETWWMDNLGVEHLILLELKPRPSHQLKWGSQNKLGVSLLEGVDEFGKKTGGNT